MDSLRGQFGKADYGDDEREYDWGDDDTVRETPPSPVGQDERRMQVRAYNHWASLLGDRNFPAIEDLDPESLGDFGPHSVLLDFTAGIDDPAIQYLGDELAAECGAEAGFEKLSDVPSRSLLSRITDHYMQILANQAPIGFEAEFVNQRGATILYRGILLPYSSDDDTIDFIYGVINWKEMADQLTADELLLEIDQALDAADEEATVRQPDPVTDWADGPAADEGIVAANEDEADNSPFPSPAFGAGLLGGGHAEDDEYAEGEDEDWDSPAPYASLLGSTGAKKTALSLDSMPLAVGSDADSAPIPAAYEPERPPVTTLAREASDDQDFDDYDGAEGGPIAARGPSHADFAEDFGHFSHEPVASADMGLYDCLAAARELAQAARSCEDRSRVALYAAVGRAYDFSLAAEASPDEFNELVSESGLSVQDRAPMTPVVKLVFGADYDKTRLTEYAAVLAHAHRIGIERGTLAQFLSSADGGLKGVIQAERRLRREEAGKPVDPVGDLRAALAKKLRAIETTGFDAIEREGEEFALVMIRRLPDGTVAVVGEIADDIPLLERAARKLVA